MEWLIDQVIDEPGTEAWAVDSATELAVRRCQGTLSGRMTE